MKQLPKVPTLNELSAKEYAETGKHKRVFNKNPGRSFLRTHNRIASAPFVPVLNQMCATGAIPPSALSFFYMCLMETYHMGHDDVIDGLRQQGKL